MSAEENEQYRLKVTIDVDGQIARVFLSGRVDEDSDLSSLLDIQQSEIIFDFNDLVGMNSCGIREWIRFMNKIPDAKIISYTNCPVQIIEQINMIMDFRREGTSITSFYAPYYCEECDKEDAELLTIDDVKNIAEPPVRKCKECGSEMEFDYPPQQYFRFLNKA
ncbi:MAG: hypothetical protein R2827_07005 [Bdellovibrionales bacterium]